MPLQKFLYCSHELERLLSKLQAGRPLGSVGVKNAVVDSVPKYNNNVFVSCEEAVCCFRFSVYR